MQSRLATKTMLGRELRYTNYRRSNIYIGLSSCVNLLLNISLFQLLELENQFHFIKPQALIIHFEHTLQSHHNLSLSFFFWGGSVSEYKQKSLAIYQKYTMYLKPHFPMRSDSLPPPLKKHHTITRCKETETENPPEPFQKVWAQRPLWVWAVEP